MTSPTNNVAGALMALKQVTTVGENLSQENIESAKKVLAKLSGSDFEYWIRKDKVTIGRNSSHGKVDVNIEMSSYVSRKHLQINYEKGRFFLVCVGKNGVFVNGQFHRLGAPPCPLDKACYIRFPSTSIRLNFEPHPIEVKNTNGEAIQQADAKYFADDSQVKSVQSGLTVPPLMHSKSLSPITNPQIENKDIKHEFSSPSLKYVIPRDPRGFLSAPPSPTGTISAMNSCPSSPRGDTSHFLNQSRNVVEDLNAAATAIAGLEKRDGKFSGTDGVDAKPPYSYAQLIIQAISSAPKRQLTLSGIYAHITKHYPYYRTVDKGWQNSIRHNLSLNRYFVKVPRSQEESGKGSFWRVDPASERKLVEQAWRKRRQRAVPCFCSSITSVVSTVTRSAPVSPEHPNPMSPVSALRGSVTASQEDYSTAAGPDADGKMQLLQFATRYAQSAPGSPASLRHGVVVTTVAENDAIESVKVTQQATLPPTDSNRSKVLWPLRQISTLPVSQSQLAQTAVIKADASASAATNASAITYNATAIDSSQVTSVSQIATTASVNLASISSLTPQQQQQLLQQSLQHQVVMMAGQTPHRVQQAIPINVSTIVAAPNNLVTSGIPFVLPVSQQQYVVRRASEDASNEPATKKAKPADSVSPNETKVKSSD